MPPRTPRSAITALVCLAIGAGAALGPGATAGASQTPTAASSAPAAEQLSRFHRLKELFFRTVHKEIIKQGLSPAVADCVVAKLRVSITKGELKKIFAGKQPGSLKRKAKRAGAQCATAT